MQHLGSTLGQLISTSNKWFLGRNWHAYTIHHNPIRHHDISTRPKLQIKELMMLGGLSIGCTHLEWTVHVKITGDFCMSLWRFQRNVLIITDRLETLEYLDWNIEARSGKKRFPSKRDVPPISKAEQSSFGIAAMRPQAEARISQSGFYGSSWDCKYILHRYCN